MRGTTRSRRPQACSLQPGWRSAVSQLVTSLIVSIPAPSVWRASCAAPEASQPGSPRCLQVCHERRRCQDARGAGCARALVHALGASMGIQVRARRCVAATVDAWLLLGRHLPAARPTRPASGRLVAHATLLSRRLASCRVVFLVPFLHILVGISAFFSAMVAADRLYHYYACLYW